MKYNILLRFSIFLVFLIKVESYYPPWIQFVYTFSNGIAWQTEYFCKNNSDLVLTYDASRKYIYYVWINEVLEAGTEVTVKFDAEVDIYIDHNSDTKNNSRFTKKPDLINNIYTFEFTNKSEKLRELFKVEGNTPDHQIHITSLKINGVEKCPNPVLDLFGTVVPPSDPRYRRLPDAPDKFCGRRKLFNTRLNPLIVSGSVTDPGMWPWHAALHTVKNDQLTYICGGTLLSKNFVLSAAHCVTRNGVAVKKESLGVILGKHYLFGDDIAIQTIKVSQIIPHEEYHHRSLNNDIALLKLLTEAIYNNYVQPACLWFDGIYDVIGGYNVEGSVVGWGFDMNDTLTKTLNVVTMPQVADVTCIQFQPIFYQKLLNGKKFCAGLQNGASPCNGDSGGGFVVFVEDYKPPRSLLLSPKGPGAWYVKGIVSVTLKSERDDAVVCDPNGYTVFTDVAIYRDWILSHMNQNEYMSEDEIRRR